MASLGIEPSITSTNGSSSPRSALKNHSRKSSAPALGPHSKSISGQWTATLGRPGRAPRAISSMLGWVAAVSATESPSQLRPALIQRMWTTASSCSVPAAMPLHHLATGWSGAVGRLQRHLGQLPQDVVDGGLCLLDPVDRGRGDHEQVVDGVELGHLAALVDGPTDGEQPAPARLLEGANQVVGVAAGC